MGTVRPWQAPLAVIADTGSSCTESFVPIRDHLESPSVVPALQQNSTITRTSVAFDNHVADRDRLTLGHNV